MDKTEKLDPVHPGEVLLEEFLKPMELSQNKLALSIRVPARRINEIVHKKRRVTADTALRLARYFNTSPQFWLGLQMDYDLDVAEDEIGERLDQEIIAMMASTRRRNSPMVRRFGYLSMLIGFYPRMLINNLPLCWLRENSAFPAVG